MGYTKYIQPLGWRFVMKYLISVIAIVMLSLIGISAFGTMPGNTKIIFAKKVPVNQANCYPVINGILKRCLDRVDSYTFCHNQYYGNQKVCEELHAKPSKATSNKMSHYTDCIRKEQCRYKTTKDSKESCYNQCRKEVRL